MVAAAIFGGAAISGGSSLLGGLIGSGGAQSAAATNARAEAQAVQASLSEQQNAFGAAQDAWGLAQDNAANYYGQGLSLAQAQSAQGQGLISDYGDIARQALYTYGDAAANAVTQLGDLSRQGIADYYQQAYDALNPYVSRGNQVGDQLATELQSGALGAMPSLTDLSQLPGYQFTLDQGLKATQNAAAAQGLGVSGAALKGATNYAEGTANTFYNQYLNNYWANQNNRYNMLAGVMNTGAGAAANLGSAANIAGTNFGTSATNTGANLGSVYGTLGANIATSATNTGSQAGTLAGQIAQLIAGGAFQTGNQLTSTAGQLGSAAAGGATQAGGQQATAFTQGGANVGATQQSAANLQAASLTGAGNTVSNALLNNFLLNPSGNAGGSTIYVPGTSTPLSNTSGAFATTPFTTY